MAEVTLTVTLSKTFEVPFIPDEDGFLDIAQAVEGIALPGDISSYIIYKDGVPTLEPHIIKDLDDWNVDDYEYFEE